MNAGSAGSNPRSRGVTAVDASAGGRAPHPNRPTASTTRSISRSRSISEADRGVRRAAGQALPIGDRPAARVDPGVSMSIRSSLERTSPGSRQPGHRDRIVDRWPVPAVPVAMVDGEEPHQVGEDASGARPEPLQPGDVGGRTSAWWVTSSPAIRIGMPASKTIAAASGSAQMLNSAEAVVLPSPSEPPISRDRRDPVAQAGRSSAAAVRCS